VVPVGLSITSTPISVRRARSSSARAKSRAVRASRYEGVDLGGVVVGRGRVVAVGGADDAEEGVDAVEELAGVGEGGRERAGSAGGQHGVDATPGGGQRLGRVQVVGHRRERLVVGGREDGAESLHFGVHRRQQRGVERSLHRLVGLAEAGDVLRGGVERVAGEVERLGVVPRHERIAECQRVERGAPVGPAAVLGAGGELADGEEVAEPLAHLLPLDQQEPGVDPAPREGFAGEALALGDLALVVREAQVLAAAVEVDGVAEVVLRHHGALQVPAREAPAVGAVPLHEVARVLLPEREVAGVALPLVAYHLALRLRQPLGVGVAREAAVAGEGGDVEVDTVGGLVGVALLDERLDGEDLVADVLGGAGAHVGLAEVEGAPVELQRLRVVPREVPDVGEPLALLARERLRHAVLAPGVGHVVLRQVPHVGDVGDVADAPAQRLGRADDEVGRQERAEVADVGVRVDRRPARVEREERAPLGVARRRYDGLDTAR